MTRSSPVLLAVALFLPALLLAGCPHGPQGGTPPSSPATAPPPVTVNLWTIWNTDPRQSALAAMVRDFETANPGIKIKVSTFEPDAYKTQIKVALGGGGAPDIYFVWSGERMLNSFVRGGQVADLTSYMDAAGGAWRRRMIAPSLDRFTRDGQVRGVPYLLQCTFFFYNKAMFAQHGWQIPRTWQELEALCGKIKAAGITPIALGNSEKWEAHHFPFVLTQRLIGKEATEKEYDPTGPGDYSDSAFVQALQMFSAFAQQGVFNASPNGTSRNTARALFYAGKTAMFYTGTWDFSRLVQGGEAPANFWDQWDFFNFPAVEGGKGDQTALAGAPDGYVVSARSKVQAVAVKFLQFMTTPEQARKFANACQELVQVRGAVDEKTAAPYLAKYAKMVEQAQQITPWMDTMMEATVAEEYMNGVQGLLGGTMTPQQVIEKVRQRQAAVKKGL
jgi:raffinose/stachyose/melibiose transport system substrate-binding protein